MDFKKEYVDDVLIYSISGDFDIFSKDNFETDIKGAVEKGEAKIVVDMKDLNYIDSSAIGILVYVATAIKEKGYKLKLCNMGDIVSMVVGMLKLEQIFDIYQSRDDAISSF